MVFRGGCILLNNNYFKATLICSKNSIGHKNYASLPRLSSQEVTKILRSNEFTKEFDGSHSVKYYDSNQLASNNPIEDCRSEAKCRLTNGFLMGVFDGHGGSSCAQVVSKRLFYYVSACLLSPDKLSNLIKAKDNPADIQKGLLETYNDNLAFVSGIEKIYSDNFMAFINELCCKNRETSPDIELSLDKAFLSLDRDMSNEALMELNQNDKARTLSVAMSGSVAIVAHIDGPNLHVASAGDCQAVLGCHSEQEGWSAKIMNIEHNTDNLEEVGRILSQHPGNESKTVIKMERLLGQLAPLRALGDFPYKWSKEILQKIVVPYFGLSAIPPNYHTPPYLSAKPEITYHKLRSQDKFLILASDGLWDLLTPLEAVRLVGEHMRRKIILGPFKLPKDNMKLGEINEILLKRKEDLKKKPQDDNSATHLLRNALGSSDNGIDNEKISQFLTLPNEVVRIFRDDITITVVYMNSQYFNKVSS